MFENLSFKIIIALLTFKIIVNPNRNLLPLITNKKKHKKKKTKRQTCYKKNSYSVSLKNNIRYSFY